ncbi:MAG: DsbA family protein [Anaerolineaceae bacterium]|nr:DsbA family protein [Anaerolineaceae bacterium]
MTTPRIQRELLKVQREQRKKRTAITIIAVVAVLVLALVLLYYMPRRKTDGPSVGNPEAPVKVDQFSNFTCSHCANFALESEADFIKDYVDTGKVYLTYYNYQFQEDASSQAAEATYCAGEQNKFWEYKKLVYQNARFAGGFADESLTNYAKELGLDLNQFDACLRSDRQLEVINGGRQYGQVLGVNATPTFAVNGKLFYSNELREAVEAALAQAGE